MQPGKAARRRYGQTSDISLIATVLVAYTFCYYISGEENWKRGTIRRLQRYTGLACATRSSFANYLNDYITGSVGTDARCISGMEKDQNLGAGLREKRGLFEGYIIGSHVSYVHVPRVALEISRWCWVR